MKTNVNSKSVTYQTPEILVMKSVTESLLCLSDGVGVDPLNEVAETW